MTKGILLIAFGKPGYAYMAYNMALSIRKFSPNANIALASDGVEKYMRQGYESLFDEIVHFTPEEAGLVKVKMNELTPFDHTLYLDVDGCCVSDIDPLLDECIEDGRPCITDVVGEGGLKDKVSYSIWATNAAIWAWFDLPLDCNYQAIQSSMMYFNKDATPMFELAQKNYNFPKEYLTHKWGNSVPDELIFSGSMAKMGYDVRCKTKPIMFGNVIRNGLTQKNIGEKYKVLSLYGNKRLVRLRYREMYDRIMKDMAVGKFRPYENRNFYNQKHVA